MTSGDQQGASERLLVEDLNPTIRAYNLVKRLGCHTAEDVVRLCARDILYTGTFRWVLKELNAKLAEVGLGPLDPDRRVELPAPPPERPQWSFGAVCVLHDASSAVAQVRQAVIEDYAVGGVRPVGFDDVRDKAEGEPAAGGAQPQDGSVTWDDVYDIVITVGPVAEAPWVSVLSERWELAQSGRNPIALGLSRRWPVLTVTCTEGAAYELCLYRDGAPTQYAAHGQPAEPPPVAAPLDFAWLAERTATPTDRPELRGVDEAELRGTFGHPTIFGSLAGLPTIGARMHIDSQHDIAELRDEAVLLRRS